MPPHYYSSAPKRQPVRRKRSRRPLLGVIAVVITALSAVTVIQHIAQPRVMAHVDPDLQAAVNAWAGQQSFKSTVSVTELNGDLRTAAHSDQTTMVTASTYKLFVAYAVLKQSELGTIHMTDKVQTGQTVQSALNKMILRSDNISAEALGFRVGWDKVNSMAAQIGATHTDINNYDRSGNATQGDKKSTAADLTILLTKLQAGALLSPTNTQLLVGLMKQQVWRERVPTGTPDGIAVADKPGWLPNVQNDAAIVYGPKSTYSIVIMTTANATKPLADLSRIIYNQLESS